VSFQHNLAFQASIWEHNTNIDAEMSSAVKWTVSHQKQICTTFISFKLYYQWEEKAKDWWH